MSTEVFKNEVLKNSIEFKPILLRPTSWPDGREAAEGAFGRNLLANNIIRWLTMKTSFLIIKIGTYHLQINAIRKPMKLTLCRLTTITT